MPTSSVATRTMRHLALAACVAAAILPATVSATMTSSTHSITYTPTTLTTVFSVTFQFRGRDDLVVTRTNIGTGVGVVQTRGVHYSVIRPLGAALGSVTMVLGVGEAVPTETLTILRRTAKTQETSFKTQGTYDALAHENAHDKVIMIIQEIVAAAGSDGQTAVDAHVGNADDHTQYTKLTGRSGGQHTQGGTASGENYQISSTAHATKGKVILGNSGTALVVDDVQDYVGMGTATPGSELEVVGTVDATVLVTERLIVNDDSTDGTLVHGGAFGAAQGAAAYFELFALAGSHSGADMYIASDVTVFYDADTGGPGGAPLVGINTVPSAGIELDVNGEVEVGTSSGEQVQIWADTDYGGIFLANSGTSSQLSLSVSSDGQTANGALITVYALNHSSKPRYLELRGETITMMLSSTGAVFNTFTASANVLEGTVTAQQAIEFGDIATSVSITDCHKVMYADDANTVFNLQDINASVVVGCLVTLVNANASGNEISISPSGSDYIRGTCQAVEFSGTINTDIVNTGGTANRGDYVMIASDGGSSWYVISCAGIWAG